MIYDNLFIYFFIVLFGLCWGSFLNVVAYRVLNRHSFFKARSYCPSCKNAIAWYDLIPLVSWILLIGKCRKCTERISLLYPFIELLTASIVWLIFFKSHDGIVSISFDKVSNIFSITFSEYHLALLVFCSALIVSIRTDLEALVIPQLFSLWLVPVWACAAFFEKISISFEMSLAGAILGYGVLWLVGNIFFRVTGKNGLGVGDMELLAMIGAFSGPIGAWISLMLGSISGTIVGGFYLFIAKKSKSTQIPFGPFLAFGAFVYVFFKQQIVNILLVL